MNIIVNIYLVIVSLLVVRDGIEFHLNNQNAISIVTLPMLFGILYIIAFISGYSNDVIVKIIAVAILLYRIWINYEIIKRSNGSLFNSLFSYTVLVVNIVCALLLITT